jgi:hypothetical protein
MDRISASACTPEQSANFIATMLAEMEGTK